MTPPPLGRMQAPMTRFPPLAQVVGNRNVELTGQSGAGDADGAAGSYEASEVHQIQIVGAEVHERVDAHDGVEEPSGERQRAGVRVNRKHAALDAGVAYALQILGGAVPEVDGPNLDAEFAVEDFF